MNREKMKYKKKKLFRRINDIIELAIDYGWWNVITGRVKREYFDLDCFDEDE